MENKQSFASIRSLGVQHSTSLLSHLRPLDLRGVEQFRCRFHRVGLAAGEQRQEAAGAEGQ